jgi:hypothetical protein
MRSSKTTVLRSTKINTVLRTTKTNSAKTYPIIGKIRVSELKIRRPSESKMIISLIILGPKN